MPALESNGADCKSIGVDLSKPLLSSFSKALFEQEEKKAIHKMLKAINLFIVRMY
jgi:hypothetical protein